MVQTYFWVPRFNHLWILNMVTSFTKILPAVISYNGGASLLPFQGTLLGSPFLYVPRMGDRV